MRLHGGRTLSQSAAFAALRLYAIWDHNMKLAVFVFALHIPSLVLDAVSRTDCSAFFPAMLSEVTATRAGVVPISTLERLLHYSGVSGVLNRSIQQHVHCVSALTTLTSLSTNSDAQW